MLKKLNVLEKSDQLVYSLFLKLNEKKRTNINETNFILEKSSIKEDEKGIKLTIIKPLEHTNTMNKRTEFLIRNSGEVEVLKDTLEEKKEETSLDYINRTTYKLESCKEDLFRMTKEKSSITLEVREDSNDIKKYIIITPSIIYLNDKGQVLDVITQDKKTIDNLESQGKTR